MASVCYGGSIRMYPEVENVDRDPMFEEGYPHKMPKVYLEGWGESYFPQYCFDWDDDSVVVVRNRGVVKYTRSSFVELLAKNEEGEIVWMDGRHAPYSDCWKGEYLNEERGATEYTVEEYDFDTATKRRYKVILDKESELDTQDYRSLSKFVDADKLGSHFEIKDGVLLQYVGNDRDWVIPEGVTEIGYDPFWSDKEFESIVIPSTLVKIPCSLFERCKVKEIIVDEGNPKYYTNDGCLVDKETGTLVWVYSGNVVPSDDSIHKIGYNAFCNRKDLESIEIPDGITEIDNCAFVGCANLKSVVIPDSVTHIGGRAFVGCESLKEIIGCDNFSEIVKCRFNSNLVKEDGEWTIVEEVCTFGDLPF